VRLSKHFTLAEFKCKDDCGYGAVHPELVLKLEQLRHAIGDKPLRIVSGLRCPPRNEAVSGASRSAHCWGGAADIPPGLVTVTLAKKIGFTGIGHKGRWVTHVDVRISREAVVWEY
jgi:zinc D-Ala-D-Ala carboxypeptidase